MSGSKATLTLTTSSVHDDPLPVTSMSRSQSDATAEEELPPPYSASSFSSPQATDPSGLHHTASIQGLFSGQLHNLRSQIQAEEAARQDAREQLDTQILSLLVPYVEDLLAHVATVSPTPTLVEMLLVPADAVEEDWAFSEPAEMRQGEVRRVIRVKRDTKLVGDGKRRPSPPTHSSLFSSELNPSGPREFTSWGRWDDDLPSTASSSRVNDLWFNDEGMAHRLAKHLQPAPKLDRATVRENVSTRKKPEKKPGRFGGLLRRDLPLPLLDRDPLVPEARAACQEDVAMKVNAEEVSFRRENEMGIWESKTGWAIAVRVILRAI
ncbi:hypothetical protein NLU13_4385 [Sarocladium strictum]|uniref:Uncharacterized protein n=1 Tax=Sarocladium strictum TaxID=5046 RepID=A0AA39GIT1_SARSR|nr:hypothetical protein NLU13_4385 [Sarocladium strictum]